MSLFPPYFPENIFNVFFLLERLTGQKDAIVVDPIIVTPTITSLQSHSPMVKVNNVIYYSTL